MALDASKVKGNGGKKAPNLEPGNYKARVVQIIELGLQPQRPYQGQDKPPAHEVSITYELGEEFLKDDEGNDLEDKPRWISETFPVRKFPDADKAKSTLRLKAIDPTNHTKGNLGKLINAPCTVTIVNNKGNDGTVYDNIGSVTPPMKKAVTPELKNPSKVFDLDAPDLEVFFSLPQWLQDKIKGNLNFGGSVLEKALAGKDEKESEPKDEPAPEQQGEGDDNPW